MTEVQSRQQLADAILPLLVEAGWQPLPAGSQIHVAVRGSWWVDFGHGSVVLDVRDPDGYSANMLYAEVQTVEQAIGHLRVAGALPAPRVWRSGDLEPQGVTRVAVPSGHVLTRAGERGMWERIDGVGPLCTWGTMLAVFGEVTEVVSGGAS